MAAVSFSAGGSRNTEIVCDVLKTTNGICHGICHANSVKCSTIMLNTRNSYVYFLHGAIGRHTGDNI